MPPKYSASISGFCRQTGVFQALKEIRQAGYDGVDFPFSIYSRTKYAPMCSDKWWRTWVDAVGAYAEELGLCVSQAHAPWEQTIAEDLHYEPPAEIYARVFEACGMMDCRKLVFHAVPYPHRIVSADTLSAIHQYNLRFFRELLPLAERYSVTVELENTFDYYHFRMPGDPELPFITAQQMNALADELSSPLVKICLDTGHANIAGQDLPRMIEAIGSRLDCLHLNDNLGKQSGLNEDLHLFPGDGTIPWRETAAALKRISYRGGLNLEIIADLSYLSPEKRMERLRQGREHIQALYETV